MPEALETWNEDMFRTLLPRIYQIVVEINNRFCRQLTDQFHLDGYTVSRMAIVNGHSIRMANLSIVGSASTASPPCTATSSRIRCSTIFTRFSHTSSTMSPTASPPDAGCTSPTRDSTTTSRS